MPENEYEAIVTNSKGPTLVLAGPGAGKTYLLGDRVKRIIEKEERGEQITILTFGADASRHMRNTLITTKKEKGFEIPYNMMPHISTINSLGFEIVNRKPSAVNLIKKDLSVLEDEFVKNLLYRDACLILGYSEDYSKRASKCKSYGECNMDESKIECKICNMYRNIMSQCNYIDFDDQVLFACKILENKPKILAEYQGKSQHLLVDEYQDINASQFKLIEMLCRNSRSCLFAVGDDAQSIYGFRGSDPKFILQFADDFPGAISPPLAYSRRCHENIMRYAEKMLSKYYSSWKGPYKLQYTKPIGDEPFVYQLKSTQAEAEKTAQIAQRGIRENKDVLILVPKKDFFPIISERLHKYGVPHQCPVNMLSDYANDRLDILHSLFKWLKDPKDNFTTRVVLEGLLNHGIAKTPGAKKGKNVKEKTLEKRIEAETEIANLWKTVDRDNSLWDVIKNLQSPSEKLRRMRESLEKLLAYYYVDEENGEEDIPKGEFAKHLVIMTDVWADPVQYNKDYFAIMSRLGPTKSTGYRSVRLMTMRKAKGLEADIVIIPGLEDDIFPFSNDNIEEEARLFYVSMTRAKDKLYLLHSFTRLRNFTFGDEITNKNRSRFLDALEINSTYIPT